jgi:hypothetical protein
MDAFERNFEDRYANPRANLFQLIQQSSSYNPEIIRIMYECLKDYPDLTQHGSVLWALMVKTQVRRILGITLVSFHQALHFVQRQLTVPLVN